jgi:hypothetical protein
MVLLIWQFDKNDFFFILWQNDLVRKVDWNCANIIVIRNLEY